MVLFLLITFVTFIDDDVDDDDVLLVFSLFSMGLCVHWVWGGLSLYLPRLVVSVWSSF